MKVETLLPLGKVDPGLRQPTASIDIASVYDDAKIVERLGYDSLMVEETKVDPYVVMALAAQATNRLQVGTAVAIAFARSPTVTAMAAWNLQRLSKGRFTLGLGTQVKGHIERRFGFEWSPPGPWMREYIQAVRAVWNSWQTSDPLDFNGPHYRLNLIVPLFDPGPIEHPNIPIHVAAVNEYMCQVAGEVADGVRPHPVCSADYIRAVMLPALARGAAIAKRDPGAYAVSIKPLIATAPDEQTLAEKIRDVRARISFYASTPAYRAAFAHHGLGDLADELKLLSKAQRWEEMPKFITDDILERYAVVGLYDEIAGKLKSRYGKLVSHAEFSIPLHDPGDEEKLREMLTTLRED
ncbi:MAG: putative F420-dependent oxidoreductase [Gammaproteobacteria bacterium]|jgi:probable F420-dependent oxidoreductase